MYCEKHEENKVLWAGKYKCKSCNREYQRKWFKDNKEKQSARVRSNSERSLKITREWLTDYLSNNPCVDCGEKDPIVLEFDHLDKDEKKYNISYMLRSHNLESIKKEVAKCVIRCANCHRRRTAIQFNWWKTTL